MSKINISKMSNEDIVKMIRQSEREMRSIERKIYILNKLIKQRSKPDISHPRPIKL